jgi:hypothetical protein
MDARADSKRFYDAIPVFDRFTELTNPALYQALPDDWLIGLADVVQSTKAIRANRYKAVNMAGAAVIAAVTNALPKQDFPFVFGGDGASFAVPPEAADAARDALAATATWVGEQLELTLRVALMPVGAVRAQGRDVLVARFGPSKNVSYAMFAGGGLSWAEAAMKRGEHAVAHAPPGTIPNLDGLSCRFAEIPARRGLILSLVAMPAQDASSDAFRALIRDITELVERSPNASRPVPEGGPAFRWPPSGLDLEARTWRSALPLALRRLYLLWFTGVGYFVLTYKIPVGKFAPKVYLKELVDNSDFRKYDDALRMVLDCTPALASTIEQRLADAAAAGVARYGLHRQGAAVMTCFTPSVTRSDHVHFIDGAEGGYAQAAMALKQTVAA